MPQLIERLAKGQNLFDQEPFATEVNRVFGLLEALPEEVRYGYNNNRIKRLPLGRDKAGIVSLITPRVSTYEALYQSFDTDFRDFNGIVGNPEALQQSSKHHMFTIPLYGRFITYLLRHQLRQYPFWPDYIHIEGGHYDLSNGNFDPRRREYQRAELYVNWVGRKITRVQHLTDDSVLSGLEEVFPEVPFLKIPTVGSPPNQTNLHFRELKASDLM